MKAQKGFKNNSSIFNEGALYYHRQERMVGDKISAQGKIVQVLNPKTRLPFFIVEYDQKYVLDLEAEKKLEEVPS